ncbi:MAG: DMP19 family protein [Verrucomicrobiae bacterium]|nr:DMP19 family protein [Verrucomicrobiae bacterium]
MSKTNYWDQTEEAFDVVHIYQTYDAFKQCAAKYPEWRIDILAVHWTISEVLNGGLQQYFSNSTGIHAPEAVIGSQRIGKPELALTLQKAMALLGDPYPRERKQ